MAPASQLPLWRQTGARELAKSYQVAPYRDIRAIGNLSQGGTTRMRYKTEHTTLRLMRRYLENDEALFASHAARQTPHYDAINMEIIRKDPKHVVTSPGLVLTEL